MSKLPDRTIQEYEQNIRENPGETVNYWYLGLALLLEGKEEEAQITWMTPFVELGEQETEQPLLELVTILTSCAQEQADQGETEKAWLIRQHLKEFIPDDLNNLLKIIELEIDLNSSQVASNINQLIELLSQLTEKPIFEEDLLVQIIEKLVYPNPVDPPAIVNDLIEAFIPYLLISETIISLLTNKANAYYHVSQHYLAVYLTRIALNLQPNSQDAIRTIIPPLQTLGGNYVRESIDWAEKYLAITEGVINQVIGNQHLLQGILTGCENYEKAVKSYQNYKQCLSKIIADQLDDERLIQFLSVGSFFLYMEDNPEENRLIRNQLATLCQKLVWKSFPEKVNSYQQRFRLSRPSVNKQRPLRIGYLSECFRSHSVGWLAWWLLKYHDRQQFDIYLYSLRENAQDPHQAAYKRLFGERYYQECLSMIAMADRINEDEIDILVDLDSLTSFSSCAILALKPAPIQITWLGYDATGFPTVDYFIADDYVLPESAQRYYTEKIWRLPQCYIGIDGFTVATPTVTRESLTIPEDGIIYFSSQTGLKRNPDNIRLQMQIIKQVPQSYFVLKSYRANHQDLEDFIAPLAKEEGVDIDRFRFLPSAPSEIEHRANLRIADIVLDTYPYNGATTTLETLWMEIPIVTRVGEQFAARNSYTMLTNIGVTEGIAWSDEEYVEWGIKLGLDEELRQKVIWKIRKSKHHSSLWNGKQFARKMEKAYTQIWENYVV